MSDDQPTQKNISQRYDGAADYPARPHYLRHWRGWTFAAVVVGSILTTLTYSYFGKESAFSPGPISQAHAGLANDCRACHLDADRSPLQRIATAARPDPAAAPHLIVNSSTPRMDAACLQCHPATGLHLPQAASLGVSSRSSALAVVHATNCATCHREHAGRDRLALPSQQTCTACHNDADELQRARRSLNLGHQPIAASGENVDLGDGVIRFLTAGRPTASLQPFSSYAQGHPEFAYKGSEARDPAALKFNHRVHLRANLADEKGVNALRLNCADCHQPGDGGAFFQPVKYEQHCASCHSLQFQPSPSKMRIPHGDPEKVRYFLAGREVAFELALRAEGVTDPGQIKQRVLAEMEALRRRGLSNLNDLEKRIFFEGDPPNQIGDRRLGTVKKFATECAKCHEVSPGDASHAPKVRPPNIAQRWVQHGPFTHLPHQHMACVDCHGAAATSELTRDILLPSQKLCAECHRAPTATAKIADVRPGDVHGLAARQRAHGGIKWDCTSCHKFHAPPDASSLIKAIATPPPPPGNAALH